MDQTCKNDKSSQVTQMIQNCTNFKMVHIDENGLKWSKRERILDHICCFWYDNNRPVGFSRVAYFTTLIIDNANLVL